MLLFVVFFLALALLVSHATEQYTRYVKRPPLPGLPPTWEVRYEKLNNVSFQEGGLRVDYPKNRVKVGAYITLIPEVFTKYGPRLKIATLMYSVKFDKNFEFTQGGKLPGIVLGKGADGCEWTTQGASYRLGFATDGKGGGQLRPYIYYTPGKQPASFANIATATEDCGVKLWNDGTFTIQRDVWNRVELFCKLNTPGQFDGVIALRVNGKLMAYHGIRWRDSASVAFSSIGFKTFFGGSNVERFAPKRDCYAIFSNFHVAYSL